MKKVLSFFVVFALFMGFQLQVFAAECDYEKQIQVTNEAIELKAEYEMYEYKQSIEDQTYDETIDLSNWFGVIHIYNLSEDLEIKVKYNDNAVTYTNRDTNEGTLDIKVGIANTVKNFSIEVYPSDKACGKDALRTINLQLPRFNSYSNYGQCADYPDYYYCKTFVTLDDISEKDFFAGVNSYAEHLKQEAEESKKENSVIYKTINFVGHNWYYIVGGIVVIGGGIAYVVIKNRKRRLV